MDSRFSILYRKKVQEHYDTRLTQLGEGAAKTHQEYTQEVGYLRGLQDALKIFDAADSEIYGNHKEGD